MYAWDLAYIDEIVEYVWDYSGVAMEDKGRRFGIRSVYVRYNFGISSV